MTDGRAVRLGRALASPLGVLITLPLLVLAVGISILLVGRDATTTASRSMARRQLGEQAATMQTQVAFALDQAAPMLERLRELADPARPRPHAASSEVAISATLLPVKPPRA